MNMLQEQHFNQDHEMIERILSRADEIRGVRESKVPSLIHTEGNEFIIAGAAVIAAQLKELRALIYNERTESKETKG